MGRQDHAGDDGSVGVHLRQPHGARARTRRRHARRGPRSSATARSGRPRPPGPRRSPSSPPPAPRRPSLDLGTGVLALQLRTPDGGRHGRRHPPGAAPRARHPARRRHLVAGRDPALARRRLRRPPAWPRSASTCTLVKQCLSGERVDFEGDFYDVKRLPARRPPRRAASRRSSSARSTRRCSRLAGEVADGVLLNYLPASHVPWSVEQVRKGGDADRSTPTSTPACATARTASSSPAATSSPTPSSTPTPRNFERAGFGDEVAEVRERHAARDREGALAAVSDAMVDAIDVMGDADHVRDDGRGLRRRRRRRPGPHAAAVGRPTGVRSSRTRWSPPPAADRGRLVHPYDRGLDGARAGRSRSSPAAASGIGSALAERFAAEGAAGVTVVDLDPADCHAAADPARRAGARRRRRRRASRPTSHAVVARTEERFGPIDLFVSNAGIGTIGGIEATDEEWQRIWDVNVMAHVYAARAVVPRCSSGARATCSTPRRPPGCSPRSATPPTRSPSTPRWPSPSGCRSPTATSGIKVSRASARRA